jgi:hemoglobin
VTFLTEAIRRARGTPSEGLMETLKAADTAEYDHVGRQVTLRFWIPDAAFGAGGVGLFESIETADTVELMGHLTGTTAFAARGNKRAARFLAEGCAVESEHRAIARFAPRTSASASAGRSRAPTTPSRATGSPTASGSSTRGAGRCSVHGVVPTIYEWGGGEAAFGRWLNAFYDLVEGDEELAALFGGRVSEEHRRSVTAWWCEVMGGPARYTEEHGGYEQMLAKHRGLAITPELRLRFVTLLSRAADVAALPDDPEFRAALMGYAEWGTRLALQNSQPGADVVEHAPVPRWGWGVAPPYPP